MKDSQGSLPPSKKENIFVTWFLWQFYEMPKFLLLVWKNYMDFASNFFSLELLFKTFFSPWRRYKWRYPKGLDILEFFNTLISNAFSRILGAMMRVVLIIIGIIFQIIVIVAGFFIFTGWLLTPFVIIFGLIFIFLF
jgi:hypothetical protein